LEEVCKIVDIFSIDTAILILANFFPYLFISTIYNHFLGPSPIFGNKISSLYIFPKKGGP